MEELKKNSIRIDGQITVCWPQHGGKTQTLDVRKIGSKFNGTFCVNNSTICFVSDGEVFVTPYTRRAMATLHAAGFHRDTFDVPFSNWDYPIHQKDRWDELWEMARADQRLAYEEDCKRWCDEHLVHELSETTLSRCLRIPASGIKVRHPYYSDTVFPACNEHIVEPNLLGHYCSNNGRVAFVYRDGHTYVAKGYKILDELSRAGFEGGSIFVPFSNGEEITDPLYASLWEQIPKR